MVDDVYKGMFLPGGSLVLGNAWYFESISLTIIRFLINSYYCRAILHDDKVYKDPGKFNPDRFLKDGKLDPDIRSPEVASFGFGRRYSHCLMIYKSGMTYAFSEECVLADTLGFRRCF
jgi:Cytochrome P450